MSGVGYTTGYKYRLEGNYSTFIPRGILGDRESIVTPYFQITRSNHTQHDLLTIADGYSWNGMSGPIVDTKRNMVPSLVHDCLYQMLRRGLLPKRSRETIDKLLYQMCVQRGTWRWLAASYLEVLKEFGSAAAETPRKIHKMQ